jgi:protein-disulfide isomerase
LRIASKLVLSAALASALAVQAVRLLGLGLAVGAWSSCRDSSANSGAGGAAATSVDAAPEVKEIVLPGVDTSPMTPRERRVWSGIVAALIAPCPSVPVPVSQCVLEKRPCPACLQAAKWAARAVRDGASEELIRHAYKDRFDPSGVHTLPLEGSPTKGPDEAPVTIVEFADFECPHCALAVSEIDAVLAAHPAKVRLVYKSYTLPFHVRGEPSARAAFAAGQQGKFWEMEHVLFERQQHLEDADLDRYAQMLRLDLPKWKADMASAAVKNRVGADHSLGEQLKLKGTPTIYVNGRELDVEAGDVLEDVVAGELGEPAVSAVAVPTVDAAAPTAPPAVAPAPAPSKPR